MTTTQVMQIMTSATQVTIKIAAPILIASILIGLIIAILQAATQVNEQTLAFVPKLIAIAIILLVFGGWMIETLSDFTLQIFDLMLR